LITAPRKLDAGFGNGGTVTTAFPVGSHEEQASMIRRYVA